MAASTKFDINAFLTQYLTLVPFMQKILFIENLRVLFAAGISVVEALHILERQSTNAKIRLIIAAVTQKVEAGQQLSESLEAFPGFFPAIYVRMMAAGEVSGKLEDSLLQIERQMKRTHELRSKIRGALIYPAILIVALIAIGVEMMIFVLPRLLVVFKEVNAELPLPTRVLIAMSDFLVAHGLLVLVIVAIVAAGCVVAYRRERVRYVAHRILLVLPIFGKIVRQLNLARFASTLNTLLASGIPIIDAFKITADVIPNRPFRRVVENAVEKIKLGNDIAPLLEQSEKLFPPLVTQMIAVGERSGSTEAMLKELAEYLTGEVDNMLKNITTVIEPVIILFLGVVVAGMAVAVIMPLYSLAQAI